MDEKPKNWKQDLKSPWLRGIIAIVFIGFLVNLYMIVISFANPHSLVAKDYYDRGKAYFHNNTAQNDSPAANYRLQLNVPERILLNTDANFTLTILDRNNKPVPAQNAYLYGYRINNDTLDFKKKMKPGETGFYMTDVRFSLPGVWDLIVQVDVPGDQVDVAKRIFVVK